MAEIKGLIWAGHALQAKRFRDKHRLNPSEYPYIGRVEAIMGIHNVDIITVGTYYRRRDWADMRLNIDCILASGDSRQISEWDFANEQGAK